MRRERKIGRVLVALFGWIQYNIINGNCVLLNLAGNSARKRQKRRIYGREGDGEDGAKSVCGR